MVSSWAISGISFVRPATLFLPLGKVFSMNSFLVPLGQTSSDDQIIRSSQVWKANITKSVMNFRVEVLSDFGREMGSPRVWVSAKRLELYDLVEKWKLILSARETRLHPTKMASHLNKSKLGSVSLSELMFQPILFDKETDHLRVKRLFIQIGAAGTRRVSFEEQLLGTR